jgi:hypothetical protein
METRTVQNSLGADLQLTTFFGPHDWANSNDQAILDAIWDHPRSLQKPFYLIPLSIVDNNADAQIQIKECLDALETLTLTVAWEDISSKIFAQICPNFVGDPAAIIQSIHQVSYDSTTPNKKITLSVLQVLYFNAIQRLTNFLPKTASWSIDVTQHFLSHLVVDIRDQMKGQGHTYDPSIASRAPFAQISTLQSAFSAAILAELNLQRVRNIAQQEVKSTHAFHSKLTNNMSVAKKTLQRHQARECWAAVPPTTSTSPKPVQSFALERANLKSKPSSTPLAKIFRNAAKLALRKLTTKGSRAATATISVRSS